MPKRALSEHRPWLLVAIAAAIAFYFLRDNSIGGVWLIMLKGTGVGALAIFAFRRLHRADGRLLALTMALSAVGDMAIELSLELGGAAFFASHIAAIALYFRNRRDHPSSSQKLAGVALLLVTPVVCWLLTHDSGIALYGLALGGMAAAAWLSRFPRYRVGTGAVLFVVSDWLIFSDLGVLADSPLPDLFIWPIYFSGQFLIATGVVQMLRGDIEGDRPALATG